MALARYEQAIQTAFREVADVQQQALTTPVLQKLVNQVRLYAALGGGND